VPMPRTSRHSAMDCRGRGGGIEGRFLGQKKGHRSAK
jgi:hypothetical protein